jgi:hypothetical protein
VEKEKLDIAKKNSPLLIFFVFIFTTLGSIKEKKYRGFKSSVSKQNQKLNLKRNE